MVSERREGTRHLYAIDAAGLAALRAYLESHWDAALRSFKDAADAAGGSASMSTEPIVRTITCPPRRTRRSGSSPAEMTSWWPLQTHTRGDDQIKSERVVVEERVGGRVFEVLSDGSEGDWGVVTAWEPGHRVMLDWKPNDEDLPSTEVEVTFAPAGTGTTVTLVHRRWDLLGPLAEAARAEYASGWILVFDERFGGAAGHAG